MKRETVYEIVLNITYPSFEDLQDFFENQFPTLKNKYSKFKLYMHDEYDDPQIIIEGTRLQNDAEYQAKLDSIAKAQAAKAEAASKKALKKRQRDLRLLAKLKAQYET